MGLIKSALKTGIAMKAIDFARREARKPENQRKARELFDRVRHEVTKPENQRKAKEMVGKVTKGRGGSKRL